MAWSDLLVRVAASGALRKRIIGALEAGAISMVSSDSALIPDVDVIAIDPAEPTSVRRLRVKPSPRASASSRPPCATVETP